MEVNTRAEVLTDDASGSSSLTACTNCMQYCIIMTKYFLPAVVYLLCYCLIAIVTRRVSVAGCEVCVRGIPVSVLEVVCLRACVVCVCYCIHCRGTFKKCLLEVVALLGLKSSGQSVTETHIMGKRTGACLYSVVYAIK